MPVSPVTPPTVPVPEPAAQPLSVTLPGGLLVAGVATSIGATSLTQALALVGSVNASMAPLGPVFAIIDAVLAVKDFAQAVPELITNPGAVVEAIGKLITKISKLVSLVPQLSVPVMILGVVDAVLSLLAGVVLELRTIQRTEQRIASALERASALPAGPRAALETIAGQATNSVAVQRADLATALASAGPLLAIVNIFVGLIGIPGVSLDLDVTSGSLETAIDSLNAAITALRAFRRSIPV